MLKRKFFSVIIICLAIFIMQKMPQAQQTRASDHTSENTGRYRTPVTSSDTLPAMEERNHESANKYVDEKGRTETEKGIHVIADPVKQIIVEEGVEIEAKRIVIEEPNETWHGPYIQDEIRNYTVNRMLSERSRDHTFNIQPGYIKRVEIYWHDRIGDETGAGGRVFVVSPKERRMLTPDNPDVRQHGAGAADISKKGNWSGFTAESPVYCGNRLIVQIVDDDAWVYRFRVEYIKSPNRRPHTPEPKPYTRHYSIDETVRPYRDPTLSLRIDPGYVQSVEVRWNDKPGDHRAYGRVFLDLPDSEGLMIPKDPINRFGMPAADIHKTTHWTKFRARNDRSQFCEGRLILEILNDKAKIYEVKVNYSGHRGRPTSYNNDDDHGGRYGNRTGWRNSRNDTRGEHREETMQRLPDSNQSLYSDRYRDVESIEK